MRQIGLNPFLAALLAVGLSLSPAQAGPASGVTPATPTISVEAAGKVLAKPDLAKLTLAVESQAAAAEAASRENSERAQALLTALQKMLGPEDKVRTLSFRVTPVRSRPDKTHPAEIKGYQAVHRLQLEVRDLARLGQFIDAALKHGASWIDGPFWGHSRQEELQRQAAVDALGRARRLAEALAQASGLKIKEVEKISTGVSFLPLRASGEAFLADKAAGPPPLEVGEEEIKAQVQAVFRLQP